MRKVIIGIFCLGVAACAGDDRTACPRGTTKELVTRKFSYSYDAMFKTPLSGQDERDVLGRYNERVPLDVYGCIADSGELRRAAEELVSRAQEGRYFSAASYFTKLNMQYWSIRDDGIDDLFYRFEAVIITRLAELVVDDDDSDVVGDYIKNLNGLPFEVKHFVTQKLEGNEGASKKSINTVFSSALLLMNRSHRRDPAGLGVFLRKAPQPRAVNRELYNELKSHFDWMVSNLPKTKTIHSPPPKGEQTHSVFDFD